jgi:hypothetical protein
MHLAARSARSAPACPYVAEVDVTLIEESHEWAPFIPAVDMRRIDKVRRALRQGDIAAASKLARVYELKPVAAE